MLLAYFKYVVLPLSPLLALLALGFILTSKNQSNYNYLSGCQYAPIKTKGSFKSTEIEKKINTDLPPM